MRIRCLLAILLLALVVGAGCAAPTTSPTAPPTVLPSVPPTTPLAASPVPSPVLSAVEEPTLPPDAVSGVVYDENGPVAGATVRVRATDNKTVTTADGSFTLGGLTAGVPVSITAWVEG